MALTDISVRAAKPRDRLFKLSDGGPPAMGDT